MGRYAPDGACPQPIREWLAGCAQWAAGWQAGVALDARAKALIDMRYCPDGVRVGGRAGRRKVCVFWGSVELSTAKVWFNVLGGERRGASSAVWSKYSLFTCRSVSVWVSAEPEPNNH